MYINLTKIKKLNNNPTVILDFRKKKYTFFKKNYLQIW